MVVVISDAIVSYNMECIEKKCSDDFISCLYMLVY